MIANNLDNSTSSSRKTLLERLAALRINSSSPKRGSSNAAAPDSPNFIPRSTQNVSTKSKFYNYPTSKDSMPSTANSSQNEIPSSPSIGKRRNFSGLSSNNHLKPQTQQITSPIGMSSPKSFPKQKSTNISEYISFPKLESVEDGHVERNHSVKEVVTSFIDSFTILNNFLIKATNSTTAKLHLQNMNTSFVALQMDLKTAVKSITQLQEELRQNFESDNESLRSENDILRSENENLRSDNEVLRSELENNKKIDRQDFNYQSLEDELKFARDQITEITIAFEKEKENVEFLQNYMEEVIQLKDEGEQQVLKLEKQLSDLSNSDVSSSNDIKAENDKLKETIKLLELERSSSKNSYKQALEVLEATKHQSPGDIEKLNQELKMKQVEIEKLRGREQHFKESNEIFQQKLQILTEENRKLKGQRPINHY